MGVGIAAGLPISIIMYIHICLRHIGAAVSTAASQLQGHHYDSEVSEVSQHLKINPTTLVGQFTTQLGEQ